MSDKTTLFAQKLDGKNLEFEKPSEFFAFSNQARPGRYVVEIARRRPPKTQKQCAVIFALMIKQTIQQADELGIGVEGLMRYLLTADIPKGVGLTTDYLHALMYIICPTFNDEGKQVTLSKMNTVQANSLFERFRNIMAPLGIVIDDPNPNWRNDRRSDKCKNTHQQP